MMLAQLARSNVGSAPVRAGLRFIDVPKPVKALCVGPVRGQPYFEAPFLDLLRFIGA